MRTCTVESNLKSVENKIKHVENVENNIKILCLILHSAGHYKKLKLEFHDLLFPFMKMLLKILLSSMWSNHSLWMALGICESETIARIPTATNKRDQGQKVEIHIYEGNDIYREVNREYSKFVNKVSGPARTDCQKKIKKSFRNLPSQMAKKLFSNAQKMI